MSTFDDRERAFENKHAHDQEMQFKAVSRRNKKAGLWAAGLLGKSGQDADDYALEVVRAEFGDKTHKDVFAKLCADLNGHADAETIRTRMEHFLQEARRELIEQG